MQWSGWCLSMLVCAAAQAAGDPAIACLESLAGDARFASIASHMGLGDLRFAAAPTLDDAAYPDAAAAAAIGTWTQARRECLAQGGAFRRLHVPASLTSIESAAEAELARAAGELAARRLNYGKFNRRAQAIVEDARDRHLAAVRELRLERQSSGDGAARAAALATGHGIGSDARDAAVTAARRLGEAARLAADARLQAQQQAARDTQAREAVARSAADTQRQLNTLSPPTQPALAGAVPAPPNVSCYPTGVDWRCAAR
jgi:hypothetical protein